MMVSPESFKQLLCKICRMSDGIDILNVLTVHLHYNRIANMPGGQHAVVHKRVGVAPTPSRSVVCTFDNLIPKWHLLSNARKPLIKNADDVCTLVVDYGLLLLIP